jgi:hypothetical protein
LEFDRLRLRMSRKHRDALNPANGPAPSTAD